MAEKTFTQAWNEKWADWVKKEKGVARVMEHRTIDEDTEIFCLAMDDKKYQVRIYSKGKGKVHGEFEKSTEALASYRELRDKMKPDKPAKKPAAKKEKAEKKPAKKAAAKKPAKKAAGKKAASKKSEGDDFWD